MLPYCLNIFCLLAKPLSLFTLTSAELPLLKVTLEAKGVKSNLTVTGFTLLTP